MVQTPLAHLTPQLNLPSDATLPSVGQLQRWAPGGRILLDAAEASKTRSLADFYIRGWVGVWFMACLSVRTRTRSCGAFNQGPPSASTTSSYIRGWTRGRGRYGVRLDQVWTKRGRGRRGSWCEVLDALGREAVKVPQAFALPINDDPSSGDHCGQCLAYDCGVAANCYLDGFLG